jgi:nucleotide-binding universal stress UspA family protein
MKTQAKNGFLVAIDGSDRSLQTSQYLADITFFRHQKINLFHVFNKIPESYYDLSKEPFSLTSASYVRGWETQQRKNILKHMNHCKELLLAADFHPKLIDVKIHNRKIGIARDIIAEAKKDYRALVLRRRGMGQIQGLIMGSVAFKLINGVNNIPLMFAAKRPFNHRVLIAIDGSESAMRAVKFAGNLLKDDHCHIKIVSILRNEIVLKKILKKAPEVEESFNHEEKMISDIIEKSRSQLMGLGIAPEAIEVEIIKDADSRAFAIVQAASSGNFSTIIIGRRGVSRIREFVIGRVSNRILHLGREFGVWIVP